jgi:RNA polymerase sigma-70 factor (ECF subfamily)
MKSTQSSLLSRLRNTADQSAWHEFEEHYREFLVRYCRRRGLQPADAEDIVQHVFAGFAAVVSKFSYDPRRGRFRDYLYRCVSNAIAAWASRTNRPLQPLDSTIAASLLSNEPHPGDALVWEEEWVAHHYRLAIATVRQTFDEKSVALFDQSLAGAKVADLARDSGMSEQAVHKVRQRIRDRMEALIAEQVRDEDAVDEHL